MRLRVNIFNTSSNLPLLVAIENRFFERFDLQIELQTTPNSDQQRAGLASGQFEIAHAAVDNAVAMVESAQQDVVIVCGGDAGMNDFMVRNEIDSMDELRGRVLAVDAPNTAFALIAKKILKNKGLVEGRDYSVRAAGGTGSRAAAMVADSQLAAGMVNPPFSFSVRSQGLKSLGSQFEFLGPYQATGGLVMRAWAAANEQALVHYLTGLIEGQRHVMNPANQSDMLELLSRSFKLTPSVAEGTYQALVTPGSGLAPDAEFSHEGFATVLNIRAEMEGMWGGYAPPPDKYFDLAPYGRALALARTQFLPNDSVHLRS